MTNRQIKISDECKESLEEHKPDRVEWSYYLQEILLDAYKEQQGGDCPECGSGVVPMIKDEQKYVLCEECSWFDAIDSDQDLPELETE